MNSSDVSQLSVHSGGCYIFPLGEEWAVFAPDKGLLFRTNKAAAEKFQAASKKKTAGDSPSILPMDTASAEFKPTAFTLSPSNACGQACLYCYGTPAHQQGRSINMDFCRTGIDLIAVNAAETRRIMEITYHGVGEPTLNWSRFSGSVLYARETAEKRQVPLKLVLCTGGQLTEEQARFVAAHFDEVDVSLDGPPEIQQKQRPRRDGKDSFAPALNTAVEVQKASKKLRIRTTVTGETVRQMERIVSFFARHFSQGTEIYLGDMCTLPWTSEQGVSAPLPEVFVPEFFKALDGGDALGVRVRHPDISVETLAMPREELLHMCLTPFNTVIASYDIPNEGGEAPVSGEYGVYDEETRSIRFDHEKRRRLEQQQWLNPYCRHCLCQNACGGRSGVRGKLPADGVTRKNHCRIRRGIAQGVLGRVLGG